jgi:glycosyltransferase involved in cell wall biosynthesis
MEISVIVPALNEEDTILPCLKALLSQSFPREKYEIIVSDGYSHDRTVEIARKYADKVIITKKRGIWYGRNFGAKFAKGKYLVFIDADTMVKEDYLKTIHRHFEKGYIGVSTAFSFSNKNLRLRLAEPVANAYYLLHNIFWGYPYLLGFNICMTRKVFEEVGGFKKYELEDIEMSEVLRKKGKTLLIPKRLALTSPRRLEAFGLFGALRYYLEMMFIQKKNIDPQKHKRIFKYGGTYCKIDKEFGKASKISKK